jgi:hypothetical protein
VLDSQSAKTAEGGEAIGYDAGKRVRGRKRHLLVDTAGLVLRAVGAIPGDGVLLVIPRYRLRDPCVIDGPGVGQPCLALADRSPGRATPS